MYGFIAAEAAILLSARGMDAVSAEQMGIRVAIGSIVAFLVLGLVLLLKIRQPQPEVTAQPPEAIS